MAEYTITINDQQVRDVLDGLGLRAHSLQILGQSINNQVMAQVLAAKDAEESNKKPVKKTKKT